MDEEKWEGKPRCDRLRDNFRNHVFRTLQGLKHAELQSLGRSKQKEDAAVLDAAAWADDPSPLEGQKVSVTEVEHLHSQQDQVTPMLLIGQLNSQHPLICFLLP